MPVRTYSPGDISGAASVRCSVRLPLPPDGNGNATLARAGNWEYVKYESSRPLESPAKRADFRDGGFDGIYTGEIGGCSVIAFLFGLSDDHSKYRTPYDFGSLAHLAGGDPSRVDWDLMRRPYTPDEIRGFCQHFPYGIVAVILTDSDYMLDSLSQTVNEQGIPDRCITGYVSIRLSGAGVNKHGYFGLTPKPSSGRWG